MKRVRWRPTLTLARAVDLAGCVSLGILSVVAYCVGLGRNGLGNPFYAAAVQSGAHNFHNAFFASINFGGTMSVDKPPLSLWLMEISVRIFGLSPFGELLPNALAGVATTVVVVLMVREWTSLRWGLIAGLASLASPMANVMFRFNNPDALLTLLTACTVWCFSSALRRPAVWKFAGAGALIGAAILTKLLAGIVIVPALVLAYAIWAPASRMARIRHLAVMTVTAVVSSGWYFVIVAATPPSHRPWIDGTTDDNPFSLLFANNVDRLVGTGHRAAVSPAGFLRMFNHEELPNYAPLIVLSVLTTLAMVISVRWARADSRAAVLINTSALWVCLVISFIGGAYHSYYAVVSTPLLAAGTVMNLALIWRYASAAVRSRVLLPVLLGIAAFDVWVWPQYSTGWTFYVAVVLTCTLGVLALAKRRWQRIGVATVVTVAVLMPGYYTWISWKDHHNGGSPLGGPQGGQVAWGDFPPHPDNFNFPSRVTPELRALLQSASSYTYAVAMQRDEEAASIQVATGVSVLPLTGFGTIPDGMFARFKDLIAEGSVRYFLPTGPPSGIVAWVESHFAGHRVDQQMVYDLTRPPISPQHHTAARRHPNYPVHVR